MIEIAEAIRDTIRDEICSTTYEGQQVQYVVVGSPPVFNRYPAITVELDGNVNEHQGMGIGWISQEHHLTITIWCSATTYDESYRLRAKLATTIETRLFKTVFPLVKPYLTSPLSASASRGDTTIILAGPDAFCYYYAEEPLHVYLAVGRTRYPAQFISQAGSVFELGAPLAVDLPILTSLAIRPLICVYDSYCEGIDYGKGSDANNVLLLHATIPYRLKIARHRYGEPYTT